MEVGALSIRKGEGSELDAKVRVLNGIAPAGRRVIVILVHGYANSQEDASVSYEACLKRLAELPGPMSTNLTAPFFMFHWPGDLAVHTFSPASYPWKITPAILAGQRLGAFLSELTGPGGTPIEVHLVSHSLGGRVVLELLAFLARRTTRVVVRSLSIMAAAVPVETVRDPAGLREAALLPQRTQALHSTEDVVLQWAFPPGQTLAGDGFFPEAVGRYGSPDGVWTRRPKMAGYGHSEYWTSIYPAQLLAEFLGAPVAPTIAAHAIPARSLPPEHVTASASIRDRRLPKRHM